MGDGERRPLDCGAVISGVERREIEQVTAAELARLLVEVEVEVVILGAERELVVEGVPYDQV